MLDVTRALVAASILLAATLAVPAVTAAQHDAPPSDGDPPLPYPQEEVDVIQMDGLSANDGRVVLVWPTQENVTRYETFVSPRNGMNPDWTRIQGDVQRNEERDEVFFVDESPPEPAEGQHTILYLLIAYDDQDEPVGQGVAEVEPFGDDVTYPFPEEEREVMGPNAFTRNLVAILSLAVVVTALFLLVWARRRG